MKGMLKTLLWIVTVIPVLILIAVLVLPRVIDPNDYRQEIAELVSKQTGRDFAIDGPLSLSIFPWVGVRAEDAWLAQPASLTGGGAGKMLEVGEMDVRVKLMPLFSRRAEVDTVVLKDPSLNIIIGKDGESSLDGLGGAESAGKDREEVAEDTAGAAAVLAVQGLELENGHLVWDDRAAGQRFEIRGLTIQTGELLAGAPAPVSIAGEYLGGDESQPLQFALKTQAAIDVEQYRVDLSDVGLTASQGEMNVDLRIDEAHVDQQSGAVRVAGLSADSGFRQQPVTLRIAAADANLQRQTLSIPDLRVELEPGVVAMSVSAEQLVDGPKVSGNIQADSLNVVDLLAALDIDYMAADPEALNDVSLSADYQAGTDSIQLKDVDVDLDQSRLSGELGIRQFADPKIDFDLTLDEIDLDRYLPPASDDEEQTAPAGAVLVLPVAVFRDLNANGRFSAGQLTASGVTVEDINVEVVSDGNSVTVTPTARLYGGEIKGVTRYRNLGDREELSVEQTIDLVQLGELLRDAGITERLTGVGGLGIQLKVLEQNGEQVSDGAIRILARDGALKGVDIKRIINQAEQAYDRLKGREVEDHQTHIDDETRFAELSGTFNLKNLRVNNSDFVLKAPAFRVSGKGDIDLNQNLLDYLLSVSVVNTSEGQGGKDRSQLRGLTIPVRFFGDLTQPDYRIDYQELVKAAAAQEFNEQKAKVEEKISEKINEKLFDLFK